MTATVRSLNDLLLRRAAENQERRAVGRWSDTGVDAWLTWGDLDRRARAIAAALQALPVDGGRVLLLYPPDFDYVAAFFGCLYAGAVAVPAYPPDPARLDRTLPRLTAIVADARATVVLTTDSIAAMFESVAAHVGELASLRFIGTDQLADDGSWRAPPVDRDTVAFLQYTSGSTGAPKGVMVTHGNLLHNASVMERMAESTPEQTMVTWLPPYHDLGLIGTFVHALQVGFSVVQMPPGAFLMRPLRWLQAISQTRASMSGGPNFAFDLCAQKVTEEQRRQLDLSSWEFAYVAAEPVRRATLERFAAAFADCGFRKQAFWPCFGLAESTLIVSGGQRGSGFISRIFDGAEVVGVGQKIPEEELWVVDPSTRVRCADGEVGEIWCRSPSVAAGYWGRAEETEATFGAHTITGEGPFLRTGDLGFLDGDELFVTGRIKEVMIVRGRKLYPTDLEDTVERIHFGASHHRPGGCVAFSRVVDGEERIFLAVEVERRQRERRRMIETGPERRRGADRRHRAFQYRATTPTGFEPDELVRSIRRVVAAEHGVEVAGVFLLRSGSIPKTSSGKKQRLRCGQNLLAGQRPDEILFTWRSSSYLPKTSEA